MLSKNTPGVKKSEAKSEAPVSSYLYTRLKSVISGRGQGPSCLLATRQINYIKIPEGSISHSRCATVWQLALFLADACSIKPRY